MSTPSATPTKSSAEVQTEAEKARLDLGASTGGFASTILTGGFGTTTPPITVGPAVPTRGIRIGA